jgi:hypothetical protein
MMDAVPGVLFVGLFVAKAALVGRITHRILSQRRNA